jgi:hypothetical protein
MNPSPAHLLIQDIAWGLCRQYQGGPQAIRPLTLAQVAVELSCEVPTEMARLALLAFAPAAYLPEINGPFGYQLSFRILSSNLCRHIRIPLGMLIARMFTALGTAFPPLQFDQGLVNDLWQRSMDLFHRQAAPSFRIWEPVDALDQYLHRFDELLHASLGQENVP